MRFLTDEARTSETANTALDNESARGAREERATTSATVSAGAERRQKTIRRAIIKKHPKKNRVAQPRVRKQHANKR